jgi:hypothetical protein
MNVYVAILTIIFGPLIFMAFLRWLSKRVRRPVAKAELFRLTRRRTVVFDRSGGSESMGLNGPSSPKWALPERTAGQHWKN